MPNNNKMARIVFVAAGICWCVLAATAAAIAAAAAAAPDFRIPNVPYHRQVTNYSCGASSAEMVLHFHGGIDVDQVCK